jgi:UPF0271 protein
MSSSLRIDLNCDCGESFGPWPMGDDAGVLPHVTSANIACGGHAGDPDTMRRTVRLARDLGVAVGAHPGFPDLQGFGRRVLPLTPAEIANTVLAQVGALYAIARAEGVALAHVKPHGALYNHAAITPPIAQAIAEALAAFDRTLMLVALAGSALEQAGRAAGLPVAREAFADRAYEADGTLRARHFENALIQDPARNLAQVISIVRDGAVYAHDGTIVRLQADTICLHGDTPGAADRAAYLRRGLADAGIIVASP